METLEYKITVGATEHTVKTRDEAVALAKKLSSESRQRVSVVRSDGAVKMQFRDGSLETYVYQTRRS